MEEQLGKWFAWQGLSWAYSPRRPPPSVKKELVIAATCMSGIPVDEELFRELARRAEIEAGEYEQ